MITIVGAHGFIGSHLLRHAQRAGVQCQATPRHGELAGADLGHVIYCAGVTGDFRERPWDTVEAHVCRLLNLVRRCTFHSILYVSSTRLYDRGSGPGREEDLILGNPSDPEDLYNVSKLAGESIVLSLGSKGRVARLSNVYGSGQRHTFISTILDEARNGSIVLRTSLQSTRDYVSVDQVADLLLQIAREGRHAIYNVATGVPLTHAAVTARIAALTGCTVSVAADAPVHAPPMIDTRRIRSEFGFEPASLLDRLPALLEDRA